MHKVDFDYTSMATFMTCRRKYDFRIQRGLVGKIPQTAPDFGKAIHLALDSWYKDKDVEKAIELFKANYKEQEQDEKRTHKMGEWILRNYHATYQDQPFKVLQTEQEFCIPLGNGNNLIGRIDKIIEWDGVTWVMDHKAQPLDSLVLTPVGWVPMGSLSIGSKVIGNDGKPIKVTGIYPQGELDCYEVTFNDGGKAHCSIDHLWTVTNSSYNIPRTMSLMEIKRSMEKPLGRKEQKRYYSFRVPTLAPVHYDKNSILPVHPYLLGFILGDGCITGNVVAVSIGRQDEKELVTKLTGIIPMSLILRKCGGKNYSWNIKVKKPGQPNVIYRNLKKMGIVGMRASSKFIPEDYMLSSYRQRMQLLRGLLDTDGCCHKGQIYFDTTSERLGKQVTDLVRSLGGIAKIRKRSFTNIQAYRVSIRFDKVMPIFGLKRKQNSVRLVKRLSGRYITSIKLVGKTAMQCISVDAPNGLYVTNDFIVTHNTTSQLGPQYFKMHTPNLQFDGYTWAAHRMGYTNCQGVLVDAILVAKGLLDSTTRAKLSPLARDFAIRTNEDLDDYVNTAMSIQQDIKLCEESDFWVPNFDACTYYGECPYRRICKEPKDIREKVIAMDYVIERWDPRNKEKE